MMARVKIRHCPLCNWDYTFVGGVKVHVCPPTKYVDTSQDRAKGQKTIRKKA
jgi:hypothetical protein